MKLKERMLNLYKNIIFLSSHNLRETFDEYKYVIKDETIEDCIFEYEEIKKLTPSIEILDENEAIDLLLTSPKSFCRLGDGEINLINGIDQEFQKYDPVLASKLLALLSNYNDKVYIGINRAYFHSPVLFGERNRKFYRLNGTRFRRFFIEHCNPNNLYFDAGFLTAYYRFSDNYNFSKHYSNMEQLVKNKKIAVVSGEGILDNLSYNIFDLASDVKYIEGPRVNAFSEYNNILNTIKDTVPDDYIICLILGMTAKVLVPELTSMGYMAWDVGHLAKDYDAYKCGYEKTKENMDKFWAPD